MFDATKLVAAHGAKLAQLTQELVTVQQEPQSPQDIRPGRIYVGRPRNRIYIAQNRVRLYEL